MYPGISRRNNLGGWEDILSQILTTGEKIVQDVQRPVFPTISYPSTPLPPISSNYPTASAFQTGSYTLPLMVAGGAVLLALMMRKRRR